MNTLKRIDPTKAIAITTATLVALLALISFVLSYSALVDLASKSAIQSNLVWLWPLLIDFPLIVFGLGTVNAYLHGESAVRQWALVALYTAGTIVFNILHVEPFLSPRVTAILVAIVAPVSLFFSFETLMQMLKNSVTRTVQGATVPPVTRTVQGATVPPVTLSPATAGVTNSEPPVTAGVTNSGQTVTKFKPGDNEALAQARTTLTEAKATRIETAKQLYQDDTPIADIAKRLDVSTRTVKRYLNGAVTK